ncbi:MAG TPA: PH domain-containing protein [Candidatus Paceibacterota bacterium]
MSYEVLHLEPEEHVILQVRKHWIVFALYAATLLLAAFLPFILISLARVFVPALLDFHITGNQPALFLFFYTLWLLTLWIFFFIDWTKYYLDVWYVTEERIIAIDQRRIFDREVSNLRFDRIQDVTLDVHGFIPTLLGFGNIKVQTASEDSREFFMTTVRNPEEIRRVIFQQQNKMVLGSK